LRGQAYCARGAYPEAITDLTSFLQFKPTDPSGYVLRGDVHIVNRNYQRALADYNTAVASDPLWIDAYKGRGIAYMALEKYGLALRDFQVGLQSNPADVEILTNMGIACMLADMPETAANFFRRALETQKGPERKRRLEEWLAQLPQKSDFEQQMGGLPGYVALSPANPEPVETARASIGAQSGQGTGGSHSNQANAPDKLHSQSARRPVPKGFIDLQKSYAAAQAGDKNLSGKLAGSYMGYKWTFSFETKGRHVSAVIRVHPPVGPEETHVCKGTFDSGLVDASDQTGYRFQGRVTEDLRVLGTLTTNHGQSFAVDMPLEDLRL